MNFFEFCFGERRYANLDWFLTEVTILYPGCQLSMRVRRFRHWRSEFWLTIRSNPVASSTAVRSSGIPLSVTVGEYIAFRVGG